jgi:hypothetical protein
MGPPPTRQKGHATAGDTPNVHPQRRKPRDRLALPVVRVQDVSRRSQQELAELHNPVRVAGIVPRQAEYTPSFFPRARFEGAAFRAYDELLVAASSKPPRQKQQLLLPATEADAGVNVNDLHKEKVTSDKWRVTADRR